MGHGKIIAGLEEGCMQHRVFLVLSLKGALGVW